MGNIRSRNDQGLSPLIGIYEIGKVLCSTLDLDQALHDVLNILSSYLNMRHGVVALMDGDGSLTLAAVNGMSLRMARSGAFTYPFETVRKVIDSAVPLVVPEARDEPGLADYLAAGESLDDERLSFLCVPIKTTEKPFGALSVERLWRDGWHNTFEHDLRVLTMVSTLIGQAVALHRKVAADRERLMGDNARLHKQITEIKSGASVHGLEDIIGDSEAIHRVFAQVRQAAPTKSTILLRGESGTGKERVAHAIHALSQRASKPFVRVNCAALSESVLESELFGHEKGAFTGASADRKGRFELAHGGTLFLDEIGEISSNFQAKLLRVLQEGEFERVGGNKTIKVDIRLIAATNRDLETAVAKGDFRADLYYRLNVVPIFLPPLRERSGDIPLLARHFLDRFNSENGRALLLSSKALQALSSCHFPGNVRELENCICRTATMAQADVIDERDLTCRRDVCLSSALWNLVPSARPAAAPSAPAPPPLAAAQPPSAAAPPTATASGTVNDDDLNSPDEYTRLIAAMERCGWVQAKAARLLGLTPRQIGYALKKHNIEIRQL